MKKTLWTLNIGNYAPELVTLTYPLLLGYAQKMGADFRIINARAFPDRFPVVYEKLQIYDIGRGNDWNVYVDSDALIFPDLFDVTERLSKDTVAQFGTDHAGNRWRGDAFFRRDGRDIGSCNWFSVASDWCMDLWHPLDDFSLLDALAAIKPIVKERIAGIDSAHLLDDYVLSRNIARYGLKYKSVLTMLKEQGDPSYFVWHTHTKTIQQKTDSIFSICIENGMDKMIEFRETSGMNLNDWLTQYGTVKPTVQRKTVAR